MKLVILDRDGTINHDSDAYIKSPEEWHPIKGSLEAIARLTQADYRIAVATNQSGIARKYFDTRMLFTIHDTLLRALALHGGRIDAFFFCPHMADDRCECRKPKPGMLVEAARRFNVAIDDVYMVGDALRDLQAADAAGARPVLVLTGKGAKTRAESKLPPRTRVFADLAEFAAHLAPGRSCARPCSRSA
jgi:D-glycero-D-manno-heptose 1,7-bisphosphate phosphatase